VKGGVAEKEEVASEGEELRGRRNHLWRIYRSKPIIEPMLNDASLLRLFYP
jgi:hypothetical protein